MSKLTITRVTHASVLLDFDGKTLLTDPWFSEKYNYYRGEALGVTVSDLPKLTGVLVSHNHYDHYDMTALAAYPDKRVPLVVRKETGSVADAAGFHSVRELDHWETASIGDIRITATPAKHSVPQNTYIVQADGFTVFFGGDTLLIPELREVAVRFPHIDLVLLPVNGLAIRPIGNRQIVMNAQEAAELVAILKPRVAIPIHYAFHGSWLGDHFLLKYDGTAQEFAQAAALRAPATEVHILSPGNPFTLEPAVPLATPKLSAAS